MCLVAINILLRWYNTSIMLSIDMQFMLDEEKLQFLTCHPSGLTPWQMVIAKCVRNRRLNAFFPILILLGAYILSFHE